MSPERRKGRERRGKADYTLKKAKRREEEGEGKEWRESDKNNDRY